MALYLYRATDAQGRVRSGRLEALHELDLESQLRCTGYRLLRARVLSKSRATHKALPRRDLISLLFQLEMLVRAGVALLDALSDLRDAAEASTVRSVAAGLHQKIETGSNLAQAMAFHPWAFPSTAVGLIRAAEASGELPQVLHEMVDSLQWHEEMAAQTRRILLYPSFVLLVVCGVLGFLMVYLVPQVTGFLLHTGQPIPWQTRWLIGFSQGLVQHSGWLASLVVVLALGVLASVSAFPGARHRLHGVQLALPLVGSILLKANLARFCDTLALLYRTGVPLMEGLTHCQEVCSNQVLRLALWRARERVLAGGSLADSFAAEPVFPALLVRMLRVGEATGALDVSLSKLGYFYRRDIHASVGKAQAMVEPVLTVILGLLLSWIMLAVLSPLYDNLVKLKV